MLKKHLGFLEKALKENFIALLAAGLVIAKTAGCFGLLPLPKALKSPVSCFVLSETCMRKKVKSIVITSSFPPLVLRA